MQTTSGNNFLRFFIVFITVAGIIPTDSRAEENLLLFYGNDIRSELEACG